MNRITPPRHIVWSTDTLDLADPFQRKWYLRQTLMHGQAQDIRLLDLDEVARPSLPHTPDQLPRELAGRLSRTSVYEMTLPERADMCYNVFAGTSTRSLL